MEKPKQNIVRSDDFFGLYGGCISGDKYLVPDHGEPLASLPGSGDLNLIRNLF